MISVFEQPIQRPRQRISRILICAFNSATEVKRYFSLTHRSVLPALSLENVFDPRRHFAVPETPSQLGESLDAQD